MLDLLRNDVIKETLGAQLANVLTLMQPTRALRKGSKPPARLWRLLQFFRCKTDIKMREKKYSVSNASKGSFETESTSNDFNKSLLSRSSSEDDKVLNMKSSEGHSKRFHNKRRN